MKITGGTVVRFERLHSGNIIFKIGFEKHQRETGPTGSKIVWDDGSPETILQSHRVIARPYDITRKCNWPFENQGLLRYPQIVAFPLAFTKSAKLRLDTFDEKSGTLQPLDSPKFAELLIDDFHEDGIPTVEFWELLRNSYSLTDFETLDVAFEIPDLACMALVRYGFNHEFRWVPKDWQSDEWEMIFHHPFTLSVFAVLDDLRRLEFVISIKNLARDSSLENAHTELISTIADEIRDKPILRQRWDKFFPDINHQEWVILDELRWVSEHILSSLKNSPPTPRLR